MNKYFLIRASSDSKIIGVNDGGGQAEIIREKFTNKSYFDNYLNYYENCNAELYWKNRLSLPDFEIEFEYVRLRKKAILTDFLDFFPNLFNGGIFLLSEKAINIFKKFKLGNYKIFNAFVYTNEVRNNYYFLCTSCLSFDVVNFDETIFIDSNDLYGEKKIDIKSGKEFEDRKEIMDFKPKKIVFNEMMNQSLDYFIPIISIPNIFISEGLKEAIEAENLTGLNIIKPDEPLIEFNSSKI